MAVIVTQPVSPLAGMTQDDVLARCRVDLEFYARHFLKILDKRGKLVPLIFNSAQKIIHAKVEEQLAAKGMVRAKVVKARQQGSSTYFQARSRWRMKFQGGQKVYVVSHEAASTSNLLKMAKRFQAHEPDWARPSVGTSNANEIWLDKIDSRYEIVTAGSKEGGGNVGRSGTAQILHGSEAAYWGDPENTWAALAQVVPREKGTEIYIESTGNGPNDFNERIQADLDGDTDYIVIFVPWFVQAEYRIPVDTEITYTEAEEKLVEAYKLTPEQIAWRRLKIKSDFKGDETRFAREYPNTIADAFRAANRASYYSAELIAKCQSRDPLPAVGKLLIGCDPATSDTGDTCGLVFRRGRVTLKGSRLKGKTGMQIAGLLAQLIEKYRERPGVRVFLDVGGLGIVIYDRLVELGYGEWVEPVSFGEAATDDRAFANRRAEMAHAGKEYLEQGACLPPEPMWMAEFTATASVDGGNSEGKLLMEPKKKVKKVYGRSPDLWDAWICTFASPTNIEHIKNRGIVDDGTGHGWLRDTQ